ASKASRVVTAARGRAVVDFGIWRMHGVDAGLKSARAFHVAGVSSTSNVLAGQVYGVPVSGTMAHSYIQAFARELDAFRTFAELYPETILLVDTYDTLEGVRRVIELARELGPAFRVRGIRLDSGDLAELAFRSREMLDAAGLEHVEIFASGGLDEYEIDELVKQGAPITGLGVGTSMGLSADAPAVGAACGVGGVGRASGRRAGRPFRGREMRAAGGPGTAEFSPGGAPDESELDERVTRGAPIRGLGVGARMGPAAAAPALDFAH